MTKTSLGWVAPVRSTRYSLRFLYAHPFFRDDANFIFCCYDDIFASYPITSLSYTLIFILFRVYSMRERMWPSRKLPAPLTIAERAFTNSNF